MMRWVTEQLGTVDQWNQGAVLVLLDPERILNDSAIGDIETDLDVRHAQTWQELRALWDIVIRRNPAPAGVILVRSEAFATAADLPWDVESEATSVVRICWPVPGELREAFRSNSDVAEHLAEAARTNRTAADILSAALDFRPGDAASELAVVARLRTNPTTHSSLWDALAGCMRTDLARETAIGHGDLTTLQGAWNDWTARGAESPARSQLESAAAALAALLAAGLIDPAPGAAPGMPAWTAIGIVDPEPGRLVTELIAQRPSAPSTLAEWIDTAFWWGSVRAAAADIPGGDDSVWDIWDELDVAFDDWLRRSYGSSLQASAATPRGLHQVAPFLARRVEDGAKILLVVIDGLGFAQWVRLRSVIGLHVEESTGCLAMIPTLTTVSRQAIFAGALPFDFSDTLSSTSAEPRRWAAFWTGRGLSRRDISYAKTLGATPDDVPVITGTAAAIVVNAVDEILHGSEVLGDSQVAASVDLWGRTGFLRQLVENAHTHGYEIWITSDHGNIPTLPGSVPSEGQTVEAAGTRVRLYSNPILRQQAQQHGMIWDPPGIPRGKLNPLFPPGRRGYHSSGIRVSHGGMSLDEVVVPFVRVTP